MPRGQLDEEDQRTLLAGTSDDVSFPEKDIRATSRKSDGYWRLFLEIFMGLLIIALSIRPFSSSSAPRKASPLPEFPMKTYTFLENPRYLHEDMFQSQEETLHTLHNWIELSADARGYVAIENPESFGLSEPYTSQVNNTYEAPVYMMSVFHQLHCLSYLAQGYQSAFEKTELAQEIAHHSAHCFDYLRQSIMCAADTSLEGKTDAGPGWGSKHECKDYDAVLAWANTHDVVKYRNGLLPGEAVL